MNRIVKVGRCDNVMLLDRLKIAVSTMEMPYASLAAAARALVAAIEARRQYVRMRYREEVKMDPDLYSIFRTFDPRGF
jgi:hypothetical protein